MAQGEEEPAEGATLFREAEFGLSEGNEIFGDGISALENSRQKWANSLQPLTAQGLVLQPEQVDKNIKVVVIVPRCCELDDSSEVQQLACMRSIQEKCSAWSPTTCYEEAAAQKPCRGHSRAKRDPKLTYFMALRQLVPAMRELGWSGFEAISNVLDTDRSFAEFRDLRSCAVDESQRQAANAALQRAKLIIADVELLPMLMPAYPAASFVAVDPGSMATIDLGPQPLMHMGDSRLLAIWRAQALFHPLMQNGPRLARAEHLAYLPGAKEYEGYEERREPPLSERVLWSSTPLLSHAARFRHPLECGGDVEHLRFAGAFQTNSSHWSPPSFAARNIDVAFISHPYFGSEVASGTPKGSLLSRHMEELAQKMTGFQQQENSFNVLVNQGHQPFKTYTEYLRQLQDIKILVSPLGEAEWSEMDFEAVLCGCLLVKVRPQAFRAYPDVFQAGKHVYGVAPDLHDLQQTLLTALLGLEHSERMAKRASMIFMEYSDPRRYAGDVDKLLTTLVMALQAQQ